MNPSAEPRLSRRVSDLHASPIREVLAVIDRPGMISFAGGLPAKETFPRMGLNDFPVELLQYGPSEGDTDLREQVALDVQASGLPCTTDQVVILSGSQQGIDLVAKLFIDAGTRIAVDSPTYLAALQSFRFFGAAFQGFEPDNPGRRWAGAERPALAYALPTFQNPTGRCYSRPERAALAQACDEQGVCLFEDDPYRDLAYEVCERTPVCAQLKRASWIYQGSFSKSLAPGLRLGFLVASQDLLPLLVRAKQAADLHSSRISQWLVLQHLRAADRTERMAKVVAEYRRRRDLFAGALSRHFGSLATWQVPCGGLFFWVTLDRPFDSKQLLRDALARGVAFMPGEPFYATPPPDCRCLRLNFSHADEQQTEQGLSRLVALLKT
jgi:2-aminoadipate transaminase